MSAAGTGASPRGYDKLEGADCDPFYKPNACTPCLAIAEIERLTTECAELKTRIIDIAADRSALNDLNESQAQRLRFLQKVREDQGKIRKAIRVECARIGAENAALRTECERLRAIILRWKNGECGMELLHDTDAAIAQEKP